MPIIVIDKVNEDEASKSGSAFANNSLDFIKTTYTLELDTKFNMSVATQVFKSGNTFTLTSGDWNTLIGAFNGAACDFILKKNGAATSTTVNYVSGAVMELANDGGYADGAYSIGWFQITDPIEEFVFDINLVENSIATGVNSLIDGEVVRFSAVLVNALTISGLTDSFIQLGNKSGGSEFTTTTIERIADASNGNKQYEVIVEYRNWLCINNTPYSSGEAVGDYYLFKALMVSGDPNTTVSGEYFQTGNTGFEDESFNGFPSAYTFDSIAWLDASANVMDAFDYSQNSTFNITILGNFSASDEFNIKMFTIPNDGSEYKNRPNPINNNLMLAVNSGLIPDATPTNVTGSLNDDGAGFDLQNVEFVVDPGVAVEVTGEVVPNAAFTTLFEGRDVADRKYRLWIQCEDNTATYKSSNRVNVLADYQDAKENVLPLGKWSGISTLEMEDHNTDVYAGTPDPYLEDDSLVNVEFTLPKSTSNDWESIKGRIVAERPSDGVKFTIEEFIYNISDLPPLADDTLSIDYTENRGFKLPVTSDKHNVSIQRFVSLDTGSDFGVQMRYPYINRYESWLKLPQANDDFFGQKTQNWFPYSDNVNWRIQFEIGLETSGGGEYINELIFDLHDYNDWGEAIGSSISFEQLDSTPITKPYSDEITKVICTHELDTEDWNGSEWALIHVRPDNSAPQWLIGSVLDSSDNNNPLQPLSGETKGKLTVGTKVLTIEALFDPSKIDTSGDITFTTRVNGDTTGGLRANIYEETFELAKNPIIPTLRGFVETEEDRGYKSCCTPQLVLADLSNPARSMNDIAAPRAFGDSVTFNLTKNGVATTYTPTSVQFPNQPDAWYASIEWRDVLTSDGAGCYSIDIVSTTAGNVQPSFKWGTFDLKPYSTTDANGNIYYHGKYTARILSQFNDVNDKDGINYTDSFLLESVRFNGKFGYFQPNTEVDNVEYLDGRMEKVKREDFFTYELRTALLTKCIVPTILAHLRGENSCWLSSYNYDDFDYFDLTDKPVIVNEGATIEHIDGSRQVKLVAKFEDKIKSCRTHFQDNRQTAENQTPPPASITTIISSSTSKLIKTGQTVSYRTGDDGDLEEGREVSWFVLSNANDFGNVYRFGGTTGGYTDGTSYFDVNGVATTKLLAFPNDVMLDWSTKHIDDTVLAYYFGDLMTTRDWNNSIDWALALAIDSKSDWRLSNSREAYNMMYFGIGFGLALNYRPLEYNTAANFWTSTTSAQVTTNAHYLQNSGFSTPIAAKTIPLRGIATRNYTLTELGL